MEADGPVARAFRLLQVVVAAEAPIGVREIGRRSGLPRSTASRIVAQLEDLRMVSRDRDGGVVPGSALVTLQPGITSTPVLGDRLRPLLVELALTFGEDAALAVDDIDGLLYVAHAPSDNAVSVDDVSGERHAFHLVAPGLVAMSLWSEPRLDEYLAGDLETATEASVADPVLLRRRVERVRVDGFAWAEEELDDGVNGLAIPVLMDTDIVGLVSLYGPSYRFSPSLRPTLPREMLDLVGQRIG